MKIKYFAASFLFIFLFFVYFSMFPSIISGTLVKISDGFVLVDDLQIGDTLIGCNADGELVEISVRSIKQKKVETIIVIEFDTGEICASKNQLFYDVVLGKWVKANNLTPENVLIDAEQRRYYCISVQKVDYEAVAYEVSLNSPHTFFVTEYEILTHNYYNVFFAFKEGLFRILSNIPSLVSTVKTGVALGCVAKHFFGGKSSHANKGHVGYHNPNCQCRNNKNKERLEELAILKGCDYSNNVDFPVPIDVSAISKDLKTGAYYINGKSNFVRKPKPKPVESIAKIVKASDIMNKADFSSVLAAKGELIKMENKEACIRTKKTISHLLSNKEKATTLSLKPKSSGFFGQVSGGVQTMQKCYGIFNDVCQIKSLFDYLFGNNTKASGTVALASQKQKPKLRLPGVFPNNIPSSPGPHKPDDDKDPKNKKKNKDSKKRKLEDFVHLDEKNKIIVKFEEIVAKYSHRFENLGLRGIAKKCVSHIRNRHYKDGPDYLFNLINKNKISSVFNKSENFIELVLIAIEKGKEVERGVFIYDFGRDIGTDRYGVLVTKIRVVLSGTFDSIKTAYPI